MADQEKSRIVNRAPMEVQPLSPKQLQSIALNSDTLSDVDAQQIEEHNAQANDPGYVPIPAQLQTGTPQGTPPAQMAQGFQQPTVMPQQWPLPHQQDQQAQQNPQSQPPIQPPMIPISPGEPQHQTTSSTPILQEFTPDENQVAKIEAELQQVKKEWETFPKTKRERRQLLIDQVQTSIGSIDAYEGSEDEYNRERDRRYQEALESYENKEQQIQYRYRELENQHRVVKTMQQKKRMDGDRWVQALGGYDAIQREIDNMAFRSTLDMENVIVENAKARLIVQRLNPAHIEQLLGMQPPMVSAPYPQPNVMPQQFQQQVAMPQQIPQQPVMYPPQQSQYVGVMPQQQQTAMPPGYWPPQPQFAAYNPYPPSAGGGMMQQPQNTAFIQNGTMHRQWQPGTLGSANPVFLQGKKG